MNRFLVHGLAVLLGLLLLFAGRASAQLVPSFPLTATVSQAQRVQLMWAAPDSASHQYQVMRGVLTEPAVIDTSVTLVKITTTADTMAVDTPRVAATTYYLYVVKTTNAGGQTIRSTYAVVRILPPVDRVRITSQPSARARVGVLYTYQVAATSSDPAAVLRYRLILKQGNMTLDSTKGLLQWTPAFRGYRNFSLAVYSSKGGKALQDFSVSVGAGNGIVAGMVTDSATGKPVRRAFIRLYQSNPVYHLGYWALTDSTGAFRITSVDSGSYYAHVYPFNPNYLPQWYNRVRLRSIATKFTVADSPAVSTINFALLTDSVHVPVYRAQGNVTDTLGHALKGALVVWARADFAMNGALFDPADSSRDADVRESLDPNNPLLTYALGLNDASRWVYRAFTDSAGKYSLRLPKGFYLVRATRKGSFGLFYNDQPNLLQADVLGLRSDTANINFKLRPVPPVAIGEISGMVIDTASDNGIAARVIAYRQWWTAHDTIAWYRHYVTDADSNGSFTFANLPPGTYRILAMPLGRYVPSWYTSAGLPSESWKQAATIVLNGQDVSRADIFVRPIPQAFTGYTSISGTVTSTSSPGVLGKGLPIYINWGAIVLALDTSGTVAGYAATNDSGKYSISGLAPGTYTVMLDNFAFEVTSANGVTPSYSPNGDAMPATQDLVTSALLTSVAATSPGTLPSSYALDQNYPNPFNPTTQIRFSLPVAGNVSLVVYDLLGREVSTLVHGALQAGQHIVTWNARDGQGRAVATGVYFYRLTAGSFTATRKLLLLK